MKNKYSSIKSRSFGYFLLLTSAFIAFITIQIAILDDTFNSTAYLILFMIVLLTIGLFLWIWVRTYYLIEDEILIAKSGPLVWRIPIKEILFIRLNQKTIGGTWKLTLSWNCIEIKYKKYRAIFISPEKEEVFIKELLKINDKIVIKQKLNISKRNI